MPVILGRSEESLGRSLLHDIWEATRGSFTAVQDDEGHGSRGP